MSVTTDPRTVRTGRVSVSATSNDKRRALIGRVAQVHLTDGTFIGVIEAVASTRAVVRFADGRWAYSTSTIRLLDQADLDGGAARDVRNARRHLGRHSLPPEATTR